MEHPEGMIPVEEFAALKGRLPDKIIGMIKDGFYSGRLIDGQWYVDISETDSRVGQSVGHQYRSDYGVARGVSKFIAFVGWLVFGVGLVCAGVGIGLLLQPLGTQDPLSYSAIGLGIVQAVAGLMMIVGAQLTRATIDNADHTREIMQMLRQKQ